MIKDYKEKECNASLFKDEDHLTKYVNNIKDHSEWILFIYYCRSFLLKNQSLLFLLIKLETDKEMERFKNHAIGYEVQYIYQTDIINRILKELKLKIGITKN